MQEPRPKLSSRELDPQPRDQAGSDLKILRETWLREKKEGDPDLEFKFAFGLHTGPHDLDFLKPDFENCDVFIPEAPGMGKDVEKALNELAQGLYTAEKFISIVKKSNPHWQEGFGMGHWFEMIRMLERSKKVIAFVDIPAGHPLSHEREILNGLGIALAQRADLNSKIELMREVLPPYVEMGTARNTYIIETIPKKMRALIDNDYRLKGKKKVKILLSMGILHTPLFMFLKELGLPDEIERSFEKSYIKKAPNTSIFDQFDQLFREVQFKGSLDRINDEQVARAILSRDFNAHFLKSIKRVVESHPTAHITEAYRDYVSMFTLDDTRQLYEEVQKGRKFREVFLEFLKQKGIEDKRL